MDMEYVYAWLEPPTDFFNCTPYFTAFFWHMSERPTIGCDQTHQAKDGFNCFLNVRCLYVPTFRSEMRKLITEIMKPFERFLLFFGGRNFFAVGFFETL